MSQLSIKLISKSVLKQRAIDFGFSDLAFVDVKPILAAEERFLDWRGKGYAGTMSYLLRTDPINARPEMLLKKAKTILIFTANYYSVCPPRPSPEYGRIASYAVGKDYHKVLKKKINELVNADELFKEVFANAKFFTDAVPLLEKAFAEKAGLGFQGKNTLLISKESGSYNFIAEIITDLEFEDDLIDFNQELALEDFNNCGACTRCIDICPAGALDDTYSLDSRKCISYWTIEKQGPIPIEMENAIGEWLFGCDLCQEVCPYNRKESTSRVRELKVPFPEFSPEYGTGHWLYLPMILSLHEKTFLDNYEQTFKDDSTLLRFARKQLLKFKLCSDSDDSDKYLEEFNVMLDKIFFFKFGETPLSRAKRAGLIRNATIVARNSQAAESLRLASLISS